MPGPASSMQCAGRQHAVVRRRVHPCEGADTERLLKQAGAAGSEAAAITAAVAREAATAVAAKAAAVGVEDLAAASVALVVHASHLMAASTAHELAERQAAQQASGPRSHHGAAAVAPPTAVTAAVAVATAHGHSAHWHSAHRHAHDWSSAAALAHVGTTADEADADADEDQHQQAAYAPLAAGPLRVGRHPAPSHAKTLAARGAAGGGLVVAAEAGPGVLEGGGAVPLPAAVHAALGCLAEEAPLLGGVAPRWQHGQLCVCREAPAVVLVNENVELRVVFRAGGV
mmetsp:Transcript_92037/g.288024  ORF Transcript_92037/g.288024 Transcript_92037/m.288024 type:complete len:286 (-) Transcript_92037:114-971(-)